MKLFNFFIEMFRNKEVDNPKIPLKGFAISAEKILSPLLPPDKTYRQLINSLLKDGEGLKHPRRNEALLLLWSLASTAARFGVDEDELDITAGFSPFSLPSILSTLLIETGIISDTTTIKQITTRELMRRERGKDQPENRVIVKAASDKELKELEFSELRRPVLLVEEHYTITVPEDPSVDFDRIGQFVLFFDEQKNLQLLFLNETQIPHTHAFGAGKWWRVDKTTHPDFEISSHIEIPQPRVVGQPTPATNDQIATLLVLMVESVREAENFLPQEGNETHRD